MCVWGVGIGIGIGILYNRILHNRIHTRGEGGVVAPPAAPAQFGLVDATEEVIKTVYKVGLIHSRDIEREGLIDI
jgi:hypothetical protein